MLTPLHYYAAARDYGWSPDDEDTAEEFCICEDITAADIESANIEFWREEFERRA